MPLISIHDVPMAGMQSFMSILTGTVKVPVSRVQR